MTASDFDHACGFLLTRGRSPYMRRLATTYSGFPPNSNADITRVQRLKVPFAV
jgi:hypothetical protein